MKKKAARVLAGVMALALTMSLNGVSQVASAAAKNPKVSTKKVTVAVKKSKTVKIKNKPKGAKVTWKSKNKKIAKVSKKGKITGVKKGKTTVTAKVTYKKKGKKVKKTFKIAVTVTKKAAAKKTQAPKQSVVPTKAPSAQTSTNPSVSNAPQTSVAPSETPSGSGAPAASAAPTAVVTASAEPTPFTVPPAEDKTIEFVVPDMDMTDPSTGVDDAATVTDAAVTEDTTNVGDSHKSQSGLTTKDNGMMRKNLTSEQLMKFMGQGWNLANTMESCAIVGAESVTDYETGWGAVQTSASIIKGVKDGGFNTVRIPVAWSNMVSDDGTYTISEGYLTRVEQIVNWCLQNEMYVIINIHYDGDWWGQFGYNHQAVRNEAWKRFESYWVQIANRFEEYSDRLIFESANEELGDRLNDDFINAKTGEGNFIGTLTQDQRYEITNKLNQKFVEIVRKTGGNNTYRHLLLAGYNTDVDMTCSDKFVMPTDTVAANGNKKMSVSVHYYTPSSYCISEDKTNTAWYREDWGTEADYAEMRAQFEKMKKFTDKDYGVILGEYGPQLMSKKNVPDFIKAVMELGIEYNYAPVIWNTAMYNRTDKLFEYEDIAAAFKEITGVDMPLEEGPDKTGTIGVAIVDEAQTIKKATWEGFWSRTNNIGVEKDENGDPKKDENGAFIPDSANGELGRFSTTACDDGLKLVSNAWWWQLFVNYDWASMTQPCIRLTLADDEISRKADFQLGYTTVADGGSYTLNNFANAEYGSKVVTLKVNKLAIKPWLVISSSSPGATVTKIEVFDMEKTEE